MSCAFCGRRQHEVAKLVAGQHRAGVQICICDECVWGCLMVMGVQEPADKLVARLQGAVTLAVREAVDRVRAEFAAPPPPEGT
jgi:ATP-dependent protease Clp ATPase subunit